MCGKILRKRSASCLNRFFCEEEIVDQKITLTGDTAHHIKNVLKLHEGEQLILIKNEKELLCNIDKIEKNSIIVYVWEERCRASENPVNITLFQGIPKGDKMDFITEKATEAGAFAIIPLKLSRCIAKIEGKDVPKKTERFFKIAKSAAQQCGRVKIPVIGAPVTLKEADFSAYDLKLVCYEDEVGTTLKDVLEQAMAPKNIAVVIGPEGGISPEEINLLCEKGFCCVSLGQRILRTETAGLYTLANLNYRFN